MPVTWSIYLDEVKFFAVSIHGLLECECVNPFRLFSFQSQLLPTSFVDDLHRCRNVIVRFKQGLQRLEAHNNEQHNSTTSRSLQSTRHHLRLFGPRIRLNEFHDLDIGEFGAFAVAPAPALTTLGRVELSAPLLLGSGQQRRDLRSTVGVGHDHFSN